MISKSYFSKAISIIFIFQFILFGIFSFSDNDLSFIYWAGFLLLPLAILFLFGNLKVELTDSGIHY